MYCYGGLCECMTAQCTPLYCFVCSLQQDAMEGRVKAQILAKILPNLKTLPLVHEGCKEIAMVNVVNVYTCTYR